MLPLQRIEYVNTFDGLLAVEAVIANEDEASGLASFRSAVDLVELMLTLQKTRRVSMLVLEGTLWNAEDEEELSALVAGVKGNGMAVRVRLPGDRFPWWVGNAGDSTMIEAYISSEPWLQYQCGAIMYQLDGAREPKVAPSHLQRRTPLWVVVESKKELEKAWEFVKAQPILWRLLVAPRFRIRQDLKKMSGKEIER